MTTTYYTTAEWKRLTTAQKLAFAHVARVFIERRGVRIPLWQATTV